jgi:hypothetical protein
MEGNGKQRNWGDYEKADYGNGSVTAGVSMG